MQEFYINKDSVLPVLRMELIKDGRNTFRKYYEAIQDADVTFSMINSDTNVYKILNAKCYITEKEDGGCEEEYVIVYNWNKRDTNEPGVYKGVFTINFGSDLTNEDGSVYNSGNLIMPIREELMIVIK